MYLKDDNGNPECTHSDTVVESDANGFATKVSSKIGMYEIIEHHPRDIPHLV